MLRLDVSLVLLSALAPAGAFSPALKPGFGRVLDRSLGRRFMSDIPSAGLGEMGQAGGEMTDMEEGDGVNGALEMPKVLEFTRTKYYFGKVTVDLGPEFKPLDQTLSPSYSDDNSAVSTVQVPLPMGMVIEESEELEGRVEVVEVNEGSNAEKAGIKVGDVLRGCTAMAVNLLKTAEEDAAFNAMAGATKPGLCRAFYIADGMPFDETMNALTSNAEKDGGPGFSNLVFERHFS